MDAMDYINIRNMIRRIGIEAETTEDMEMLVLSELKAYDQLTFKDPGYIELYPDTRINGNYAVVGTFKEKYRIILTQKMFEKKLISEYKLILM